jgi:hypothetical protein
LRKRIEDLEGDVDECHKSERIRRYLRAFREQFEKWSGPIAATSEIAQWLKWANQYADSLALQT